MGELLSYYQREMIQAVKKGALQCQPLITNGCNANDKELHGWKSAPVFEEEEERKSLPVARRGMGAEAGRGQLFPAAETPLLHL